MSAQESSGGHVKVQTLIWKIGMDWRYCVSLQCQVSGTAGLWVSFMG